MKLHNATADIFIPDDKPLGAALERVTHLGIGAHQDDLEFMAFQGILQCYHSREHSFGGVICTNGSGSARIGPYAQYTDQEMQAVRRREQRTAAIIGEYGIMLQLDYPSGAVKSATDTTLRDDLLQILIATTPQVVYTHNPADKHDTHVGVCVAVIEALRELPVSEQPQQVIGCEVWRDLDWLLDAEKVVMEISARENLAMALNGCFDSQIAGGKRYDLATQGRRRAHATYFESHATDKSDQLSFGMDLTPLVKDDKLDIIEYTTGFVRRLEEDVRARLGKRLGR